MNKAIHDLIVAEHGEQMWLDICQRAGVETTRFVALQSYPDHVTYALVGETSKTLGLPPEELLRLFGKYWVRFTGREGHKDAFTMFPKGRDGMIAFIENLDDLHARMLMAMPELKPPQVYCEQFDENRIRVHYISSRQGLSPMVIGLLDGLLEYFEVRGEVVHHPAGSAAGRDHDAFDIQFAA